MTRSLAAAVLLLAASGAPAQETGQTVRGEITAVALRDTPRSLTVRLEDGTEVAALLGPGRGSPSRRACGASTRGPTSRDLQRGMSVQFRWDPRRVDRILVLAVPSGARPGGGYDERYEPSWGGARPSVVREAGLELRAVVTAVDVAAGTLGARVDGSDEVFLGAPSDLRGLRKGDRVVLVTGEGGRLASVRVDRPETTKGSPSGEPFFGRVQS